jgi:hypothetical protein
MQTLLVISILCLLAVGLAGAAVARHVRITFTRAAKPSQRPDDFAQHLVSAVEGRSLRFERFLRAAPQQTLQEVMASKSWNQPPELITVRPDPEVHLLYDQATTDPELGARKAPQSTHSIGSERLDWTYFNKDLGDLTDPYQIPRMRANSRDQAPPPKRF